MSETEPRTGSNTPPPPEVAGALEALRRAAHAARATAAATGTALILNRGGRVIRVPPRGPNADEATDGAGS